MMDDDGDVVVRVVVLIRRVVLNVVASGQIPKKKTRGGVIFIYLMSMAPLRPQNQK